VAVETGRGEVGCSNRGGGWGLLLDTSSGCKNGRGLRDLLGLSFGIEGNRESVLGAKTNVLKNRGGGGRIDAGAGTGQKLLAT